MRTAIVMARNTSMRSRTARWLETGMSTECDTARIFDLPIDATSEYREA